MIKIYKSEQGNCWIGECTSLDIITQGDNPQKAIHNLCEVLELFLISCHARGKLDAVLGDQK